MWTSWLFLSGATGPLGYVDPGIVSTALQAVFVFLFGAMTAYLAAPWRWIVSLLPGRKASPADQEETPVEPVAEPPSRRRAA